MTKTDKKLEARLRKTLKMLCEMSLKNIDGFRWVSQQVNFKQFSQTLNIICVFEQAKLVELQRSAEQMQNIRTLIKDRLYSENKKYPPS